MGIHTVIPKGGIYNPGTMKAAILWEMVLKERGIPRWEYSSPTWMKLSGAELLQPPGWTGRSSRVFFVVRLSVLKWEIMKLWEVALGKLRTLRDSGVGVAEMRIPWAPLEKAFQVGNLSWGKVLAVGVIKVAWGSKSCW